MKLAPPRRMKPATPEAYDLFHRGQIALAHVEANGIKVDEEYLDRVTVETTREIDTLTERLLRDPLWSKWRAAFGAKSKLGSRDQLSYLMFKVLGHKSKGATEGGGRDKADQSALQSLKLPFVDDYLLREKLVKLRSTNLGGIKREVCNGRLHPSFNLAGGNADDDKGGAQTYRSSSSGINFQNLPNRDPVLSRKCRTAFVASGPDFILAEADFKGIEVGISVCYHLDPTLRRYVADKTTDMHGDMARQIFFLSPDQVKGMKKTVRHAAKNMFVFPQFYGSFYIDCARDLWEYVEGADVRTPDGTSVLDVLRRNGIKDLGALDMTRPPRPGTFEHHIKKIEDHFWNVRFPVYTAWKKKWYKQYLDNGGFYLKTGFLVEGVYRRNQVINYPVQGAAFHCLLWCLIELQGWLTKNNMRSKIVGQIHDSMILDLHRTEIQKVFNKVRQIMMVDLPKKWPWIVVPLEVEIEASKAGKSWADKQAVEYDNTKGRWGFAV